MVVVKHYTNDENIEKELEKLKEAGISASDVYVLSHDNDRTARIVSHTDYSGIVDYNKQDIGESFDKQGDELRAKLEEVGLSKDQSEDYESLMDEGKTFLLVNDEKAKEVLK